MSAPRSGPSQPESKGLRSLRVEALHIITLFALIFAQRELATEAKNIWFLVPERMGRLDVILLALEVFLVLPGMVILFEWIVGLVSERLRRVVHIVIFSLLLTKFVFQTLDRLTGGSFDVLLIASWIAGIVGTLIYLSAYPARLFLTYMSVAVVLIPMSFLTRTGAARIVFAGGEPGAASVQVGNPTPVVMLVFDELPLVSLLNEQDRIDPNLYPNFARIAQDSYWFRDATTVSDHTNFAVPAILTGQYPDTSLLPTSQDHPHNLFTLLGGSYTETAFEPITHLCPDSICHESEPGLVDRLVELRRHLSDVPLMRAATSPDRVKTYPEFLRSIVGSSDQALYFDHIVEPHFPWERLPSGQIYTRNTGVPGLLQGGNVWGDDEWLIGQAYQRHLLQVQYCDTLLGQLIDRLKAVGLYDRALIVVTADHGATFTADASRRNEGDGLTAQIMPVPLLIKLPNQTTSVVSERNVQSIDILPTIADVLDVPLPWKIDGQSVFDTSPAGTQKVLVPAHSERRVFGSMIDGIDDAVMYKLGIFGSSDEPGNLYRIGRYSGLIGQSSSALAAGDGGPVTVRLDQDADLAVVDLNSDFVPAYLTGSIAGQPASTQQMYLAVAVNGVVQAVTRTYQSGETLRFTAMVPADALRQGANTVDVYWVSGSETDPHIVQLQRSVDGS